MKRVEEYRKAVAAFIGGLSGLIPVWSVVAAADWSTKNGLLASIVPVVSAVVAFITTYRAPKNAEPAPQA